MQTTHHAHIDMHACMDVLCLYACMDAWMDVCMYTCMCGCILCMHACMHGCIYGCMLIECMHLMYACMHGSGAHAWQLYFLKRTTWSGSKGVGVVRLRAGHAVCTSMCCIPLPLCVFLPGNGLGVIHDIAVATPNCGSFGYKHPVHPSSDVDLSKAWPAFCERWLSVLHIAPASRSGSRSGCLTGTA